MNTNTFIAESTWCVQQMPGKHFSLLQRRGKEVFLVRGGVRIWSWPRPSLSVHVAHVADRLVLHDAQVVHGAAEGDLDGLADAGGAAFHHFDLVDGFVHPEGNHFGSRKPLPEEVEESGSGCFAQDAQSPKQIHCVQNY